MSKIKFHGRIGSFVKSVELDRGDYSLDRLKSKFGQVLGYGCSIQYSASNGQSAVSNDKQLEEAIQDTLKRGKYNVEVVLVKDGSTPKSVAAFQPTQKSVSSSPSKPSSSSTPSYSSNSNNNSSNNNNTSSSSTPKSNNSSSSSSGGNHVESLKSEINKMRTNPNAYIKLLEERLKNYEGNVLLIVKGDQKYKNKTVEGKDAVEEAISSIKSAGRLSAFEYPSGLGSCANEVATKVGKNPVDKNQFGSIIESHGSYNGELKLLRGHFYEHDDAQDLVLHFLVSDGDKNRTSRNILLSSNLRCGGIAIVDGNFPKLCTLMFVSEWK